MHRFGTLVRPAQSLRIVAQLVAYHVRDVGVGSSSLLYPTLVRRVMDRTDTKHWFAMRATYRREMKAHDELTEAGIEVFIPMRWTKKKVGQRMKRVETPAVQSLIFVHGSQPFIQQFKLKRPYLQYMCSFGRDGSRKPIIVPDQQMEDFIRVSTQTEEEVTYIDPETMQLTPGTRVVVVNGPFEGMKGTFQRVQGHRNRQFVIQIEGVLALAIQISPNQIDVLSNNDI